MCYFSQSCSVSKENRKPMLLKIPISTPVPCFSPFCIRTLSDALVALLVGMLVVGLLEARLGAREGFQSAEELMFQCRISLTFLSFFACCLSFFHCLLRFLRCLLHILRYHVLKPVYQVLHPLHRLLIHHELPPLIQHKHGLSNNGLRRLFPCIHTLHHDQKHPKFRLQLFQRVFMMWNLFWRNCL